MAMDALLLVSNPGSSSRKYAFYRQGRQLGSLSFEYDPNSKVICNIQTPKGSHTHITDHVDVGQSLKSLWPLAQQYGVTSKSDSIDAIALRIVAPSGYFLEDRLVDSAVYKHLQHLKSRIPLHITATLKEYDQLHEQFKNTLIVGISDSGFHKNKPDYAWNYGLPLEISDKLELKRFGYHGLSVESCVHKLRRANCLPNKLVVCHLGSGSSVTAVKNGQSLDNTMGYSPLEGLVMATRTGNIDPIAVAALQEAEKLSDKATELLLNKQSGLLGISGISSDIRKLLEKEQEGHYASTLALKMYVYAIRKAIGQMTAVLEGVDGLIFTGTVGERSLIIRERIIDTLEFLDIKSANHSKQLGEGILSFGDSHSPKVLVVACDEMSIMATRANNLLASHHYLV